MKKRSTGASTRSGEGWKEVFKQRYNATMIEFSSVADQIQKLISEYTMVEVEDESTPPDVDYSEKERVVQELDRTQAYKLNDDFRYKRPYGYAFSGGAVKDLRTCGALRANRK